MNILGKILVFLNLLFALVVGGFLLIDFQTRVNWKKAFDDLQSETRVARQNYEATHETNKKLAKDNDELRQKLTEEQKKHAVYQEEAKDEIAKYEFQKQVAENLAKQADLKADAFQGQVSRFEQENKTLVKLIEDRDKKLLLTEQDKDKYFREMQQALNERDIALSRMASLQENLKEKTLQLNQLQVTKNNGKGGLKFKDKLEPNPPPFFIKGLIQKVDSTDKTLVQISLGSDHGIAVGHTLEAFRKAPAAKYLGMIQIMDVNTHESVGRLMPNNFAPPVTLKAGDQVASQILPGY